MLENGQTGTGEPQHTEQQGRHHPNLVMTTDLAFYNLLDEAMERVWRLCSFTVVLGHRGLTTSIFDFMP